VRNLILHVVVSGWTRAGSHGSILLKRSATVDGVGHNLFKTTDQDEQPQSDLDDRHKYTER